VYSERLLQRFHDPVWAGDLAAPTSIATAGNPTCGDVVQIGVEVLDGCVVQARFRTLGCAIAIAASDAVCDLVAGMPVYEALLLTTGDVAAALEGIPEDRTPCASGALAALRAALRGLGDEMPAKG
jgi:NifU-like protein involved in Fe-S cluster formation